MEIVVELINWLNISCLFVYFTVLSGRYKEIKNIVPTEISEKHLYSNTEDHYK